MKVELLNHFGSDLMIVNAARVSYGKTKDKIDDKDARLINFLIKHKHTSPFRHPQLQFRIECPIYVERQLFKHQVGLSSNCLHKDSKIRFKSSSGCNRDISIEELYNKWNNGRPHQNTKKDKEYSRKRISQMKLRVLNEQTGKFTYGKIKNVFKSGVKEIYEIVTSTGRSIKCSPDHRIWTNNGWDTINKTLSIGSLVGLNGVQAVGDGSYRIKQNLKLDRKLGLSVHQMADKYGCSYHTIRKWLKIHNLSFTKNETYFKKGSTPWNKGVSGYSLNISESGREVKSQQSKERECDALNRYSQMSGEDINEHSKTAFNMFAKRYLLRNSSIRDENIDPDDYQLHHIIPCRIAPELYFDINNVVLISKEEHEQIHNSWQAELAFAKKFYSDEFLKRYDFERIGNILTVHFDEIVDIKYIGKDETYDIEVEGPHHNFVANGIVVHNSISGRYVDFSDSYDIPTQLRLQSKDSKQGSAGLLEESVNNEMCEKIEDLVDQCADLYNKLCEAGVAKEQARIILPLCLNTQFIWTGSLAAFLHLFSLRIKPDAQAETRQVAEAMLECIKSIPENPFKYTLEAFGY